MDNTATMLPEEVTDAMVIGHLKRTDKKYLNFCQKVEELSNNIDFLKDDTWIERATKMLKKPDHDERLESQFETTVRKALRDEAFNKAEKEGTPVVPPTPEQIQAGVQRKMAERNALLEKAMESKLAKARAAIRAAANDQ